MLVRTVRKPGERGTQLLVKEYGARLACIRYRYDPEKLKRYKTVELIIGEETWVPPPDPRSSVGAPIAKHAYTPRVLYS